MNLLKSLIIASTALVGVSAASAQTIGVPAGSYVSDPTHTNVLWTVSHFGVSNYIGRFDGIQATLEIDPADPTKSKLTATIDPASVDVNYPKDDKDFAAEIESDMFFDAAKFTEITFVSTEIKTTGADTGTVTGDLTFHGVTKPVVFKATFNGEGKDPWGGERAGFNAKTTLNLNDFGIKGPGPSSQTVDLDISLEGVKAK